MSKFWYIFLLFIVACTSEEIDLNGSKVIKPNQFIEAFKPITNSFNASDTNLYRFADTQKISSKILSAFIPDSLVKKMIGNDKKTIFQAVGKIEKPKETYLLIMVTKAKKFGLVALAFNKENSFIAAKELINSSDKKESNYNHSISINKEPTFTIVRERFSAERDLKFTKIGWALSGSNFIEVVHESNENNLTNIPILNPIDTLSINNKFSGNYTVDERNILSLRDGISPNQYLFFLYIEKNEGKCIGELKGTMNLIDATHAVYAASGDPCNIDFTFDSNEIIMKEKGSCGNRRGMDCMFEEVFIKRKMKRKPSATLIKPLVKPITKPVIKPKTVIKKTTIPIIVQKDTLTKA